MKPVEGYIFTHFGTNFSIFPWFLIISLTIDEEIMPKFLSANKKIVSIFGLRIELVSAIGFSNSKSTPDRSPLNIYLALTFEAKSTVSPSYVITDIFENFAKVVSIQFFLVSIGKRYFLVEFVPLFPNLFFQLF